MKLLTAVAAAFIGFFGITVNDVLGLVVKVTDLVTRV